MYSYIAFDPGDTFGVAAWNEVPKCVLLEQMSRAEIIQFLKELDRRTIKKFIIEGYRILGKKALAHIGSEVATIQDIGRLKMYCELYDIEYVIQSPSILQTAPQHSGMKIPKDHAISHGPVAYNHGHEWLLNQKLIKPRVLEMYK